MTLESLKQKKQQLLKVVYYIQGITILTNFFLRDLRKLVHFVLIIPYTHICTMLVI